MDVSVLNEASESAGLVLIGHDDLGPVNSVWFGAASHLYLSTGMADLVPSNPQDHQFVVILGASDPAQPVEVGRWWLPGTRQGDDRAPSARHPWIDSGYRAHNVKVDPERPDRAYVGYIDGGVVVRDIADRTTPRLVSPFDHHPPMPGSIPHRPPTVQPRLPGRERRGGPRRGPRLRRPRPVPSGTRSTASAAGRTCWSRPRGRAQPSGGLGRSSDGEQPQATASKEQR